MPTRRFVRNGETVDENGDNTPKSFEAARALFDFVSLGRNFLWSFLPFTEVGSLKALSSFKAASQKVPLPSFLKRAVFLEMLCVLDRRVFSDGRSLLQQFVFDSESESSADEAFCRCIEGILHDRAIRHPLVRQAVAIFQKRYQESHLTVGSVANALHVRQSSLDVTFKHETGKTPSHYLRDLRLSQAMKLLAHTRLSIKEVWVDVGYAEASTFDHQFKRALGVTPTEYRRNMCFLVDVDNGQRRDASQSSVSSGYRVLIVDDDEVVRLTTDLYLRGRGHVVEVAQDGAEGLQKVMCFEPDVILLDLHMPKLDGVSCLQALRAQPGGHKPRVLFVTADLFADEILTAVKHLNVSLHSKLCDPEDLHGVIVNVMTSPRSGGEVH